MYTVTRYFLGIRFSASDIRVNIVKNMVNVKIKMKK